MPLFLIELNSSLFFRVTVLGCSPHRTVHNMHSIDHSAFQLLESWFLNKISFSGWSRYKSHASKDMSKKYFNAIKKVILQLILNNAVNRRKRVVNWTCHKYIYFDIILYYSIEIGRRFISMHITFIYWQNIKQKSTLMCKTKRN